MSRSQAVEVEARSRVGESHAVKRTSSALALVGDVPRQYDIVRARPVRPSSRQMVCEVKWRRAAEVLVQKQRKAISTSRMGKMAVTGVETETDKEVKSGQVAAQHSTAQHSAQRQQ